MARIRTIKPEFWSHPIMGALSDTTKCLALALLNYADDEGLFMADPRLVRNFARPFDDDSLRTQGALSELSNIGWIELKIHDSHGLIGKIVKFQEHQLINRASPSKIREYFDSGRIHGGFTEDSQPERKGKERKGDNTIAPNPKKNGDQQELPTDAGASLPAIVEAGSLTTKAEESTLYQLVQKAFLEQNGGRFTSFPKEGAAIKQLITKAMARAPDDPTGFMRQMLETFWRLKKGGGKFWPDQPFLPSALNSAGIFDRVLEAVGKVKEETEGMKVYLELKARREHAGQAIR